MLDVARNFFPKEEVYKLLDAMAMYKLNRFVFYLTEDEGWRLQIPGLPELTDVISLFPDVFACLLFSLIYSLSFFTFFVFKSFLKIIPKSMIIFVNLFNLFTLKAKGVAIAFHIS